MSSQVRTGQPIAIQTERRALRAVAALVVLVASVVGIPIVLLNWGYLPSPDDITGTSSNSVSDTALFGVVTVAAWVFWTLFVASVLLELRNEITGRQAGRTPLGPLQRSARFLVVSLLMSITSATLAGGGSRTSLPESFAAVEASSLDSASALGPVGAGRGGLSGGDRVGMNGRPIAEPIAEPAATGAPTRTPPAKVVVKPGDTAWGLAERLWGDGLKWTDLWEANRGKPQPDGRSWADPELIHPGWEFDVPGVEQSPAPPPAPEPHVVVPGDTLSEIALEEAGDVSAVDDIMELNQDVVQPDGRSLQDPDLIHPDWVLELPGDGSAAPPPPAPPPPPPPPPGQEEPWVELPVFEESEEIQLDQQAAPSISVGNATLDVTPAPAGQTATPLSNGEELYFVSDGVVRYVDPNTFTEITAIPLPGRVEATIDSDGILWTVTPRDGLLRKIVGGEVQAVIPVFTPGNDVAITLSGNRPVVLDRDTGRLWLVDRRADEVGDPLSMPGDALLQGPSAEGSRLWVVIGEQLVGLKPGSNPVEIDLPAGGHRPQVVAGNVIVPLANGTVLVFDLETGELLSDEPEPLPAAREQDFRTFVDDRGDLRFEAPGAGLAGSLDSRGRAQE